MSNRVQRRGFLAGALAVSGALLVPGTARAADPTEEDWMKALSTLLGLRRPDEPALTSEEIRRRLARPTLADLSSEQVFARNPQVTEERRSSGARLESWLRVGSTSGSVVFRTLVSRPGRHDVQFFVDGGPYIISFGVQETRTLAKSAVASRLAEGIFLKPGWIDIAITMSPGSSLSRVMVYPEAASPIEPVGGWVPNRALTFGAKAATLVKLGGWEDELPPADGVLRPVMVIGASDQSGRSSKRIRVQTPGVYTLAARISGQVPSSILIDSAVSFPKPGVRGLPPSRSAKEGLLVSLATTYLAAGDFDLAFAVGSGSGIHEVLQLARSSEPEGYLAVARAHGFPEGGAAPASRGVDLPNLEENKDGVRHWLEGSPAVQAKRAAKAGAMPAVPKRPSPISPILPTDL